MTKLEFIKPIREKTEREIITAVISYPGAYYVAADYIDSMYFRQTGLFKEVWEACEKLHQSNMPVMFFNLKKYLDAPLYQLVFDMAIDGFGLYDVSIAYNCLMLIELNIREWAFERAYESHHRIPPNMLKAYEEFIDSLMDLKQDLFKVIDLATLMFGVYSNNLKMQLAQCQERMKGIQVRIGEEYGRKMAECALENYTRLTKQQDINRRINRTV